LNGFVIDETSNRRCRRLLSADVRSSLVVGPFKQSFSHLLKGSRRGFSQGPQSDQVSSFLRLAISRPCMAKPPWIRPGFVTLGKSEQPCVNVFHFYFYSFRPSSANAARAQTKDTGGASSPPFHGHWIRISAQLSSVKVPTDRYRGAGISPKKSCAPEAEGN
jgi:hypothetical protein